MNVFTLIWLFFILSALFPMLRQRRLERMRLKTLSKIQGERGSQVVVMIHRQERFSFLGIPISRYIDIEDSEQVLRAIRLTPDDRPLDIVLHTPGGLVLAAAQIARALLEHPADVTVIVPHYAMSGGTLLALAADQIIVDKNAVLGPVDPQIGKYPAASILGVADRKDSNEMDDETVILADIAKKAVAQVRDFVFELLREKHLDEESARKVASTLTEGEWTHDYPLHFERLKRLGLEISTSMPASIYELMGYYPQPPQQRPNVQYVPVPDGKGD